MRVANWDPSVLDELKPIAYERLREAAYVVKDAAVQRLRGQIGGGRTTGISRPVYRKGPYAGQRWTAREFGQLLKSVRVTEKKDEEGRIIHGYKNIRIYAGNNLAYYALIFEYSKPFMRPALESSIGEIKSILGAE